MAKRLALPPTEPDLESFPVTRASLRLAIRYAPPRAALRQLRDGLPDFGQDGETYRLAARREAVALLPRLDDLVSAAKLQGRVPATLRAREYRIGTGQVIWEIGGVPIEEAEKAAGVLLALVTRKQQMLRDTDHEGVWTVDERGRHGCLSIDASRAFELSPSGHSIFRTRFLAEHSDELYAVGSRIHTPQHGSWTVLRSFEQLASVRRLVQQEPFLAVLVLLEEHYRQRDLWAERQLDLDGYAPAKVRGRWLRVSVDRLWERLYPGKAKQRDWRQRAIAHLRVLHLVRPAGVRRQGETYPGLVQDILDPREPNEEKDPYRRALRKALAAAEPDAQRDVYVRLGSLLTETLLPGITLEDGRHVWGPSVRRHWKELPPDERKFLLAKLGKSGDYFQMPVGLVPNLANGLDRESMALCCLMLSELTPHTNNFRAQAWHRGIGVDTTDGAGKYRTVTRQGRRYVVAYGSKGFAYEAREWVKKFGAGRNWRVRDEDVIQLVSGLRSLSAAIGLEVLLRDLTSSSAETCDYLRRFRQKPRRWARRKLVPLVPEEWLEGLRPCQALESREWDADAVVSLRRQLRLSQVALAEALGVSGSFVSQVERGMRPLPDRLVPLLRALRAGDAATSNQNEMKQDIRPEGDA